MTNTLKQFIHIQATTNNQNTQAINDLRGTINKISTTLSSLESGKFLTQPQPNPHGLCTVKRKLNVKNKAFLTEQVSALILSKTLQKFRDFASPNISIMIGESRIGRTLLDLESSVNLLPFSVYEQLGLGELKNTFIMLQLVDRSVKQPTSTIYQAPVILGRPFLNTSNALINCRSGVLKLSFGNMALKLNIFNACKMPSHFDDTSDLNVVESLTPTRFICSNFSFSDDDSIFQTPELMKKLTMLMKMSLKFWTVLQIILYHLKCNLEVQDSNHKDTFLVVIYSKLNKKNEAQLIEILRKYRGAIGWIIPDIKSIDVVVCTHKIHLEDNVRQVCDTQRRLNPTMKEVCKEEVLKLLTVAPEDQEKNTFTCPFGTFPFTRMPFGHIVSSEGIKVDKAKIELKSKLHIPRTIKDIRFFLGHAGFYRRFIQGFHFVAKLLRTLLQNDVEFVWSNEFQKASDTFKESLITPLIMQPPQWDLPFEIMIDASDYALGAILGQRVNNMPSVIYYASRTLNEAQKNYTTVEKELLAVVFALDKFRAYIFCSHVTIFTDHFTLKYLLAKKDAKPCLIR
ncbi:uncharacterized protein LOC121240861 [Juglans microcarpa x Juglans regia]|uniref:uncharacterized protein LOC121240861 n=1 Tax=Juglans microcarpa x Juglans regia TaxID=2249226 RepID=UPI001B7E7A6B|nr:uncharacterized protein LOC121240861 [Juglans microcarpa x Juglans regia]